MYKFLLLLLISVLLSSPQVSSKNIQLKKVPYKGLCFSIDSVNFFKIESHRMDLYNVMDGNWEAQNKMREYRSKKHLSNKFMLLAGVTTTISILVGGTGGELEIEHILGFVATTSFMIVSISLRKKAKNKLHDAVKIYNSNENSLSFNLNYKPTITTNQNRLLLSLSLNF